MRKLAHLANDWCGASMSVVFVICLSISCAAWQSPEELQLTPPLESAIAGLPLDEVVKAQLKQAISSRDYGAAESSLVLAIEKNPSEPRLLSYVGRVYFLDHKYLSSAIAMKKADSQHRLIDADRFTLAMSYISLKK